jgi:carboxymethylenebutenolidase
MRIGSRGRVAYEHIYWDLATLLVQVGLLDPTLLPVAGAREEAACVRACARPVWPPANHGLD